jgi:hypothetical protein
MATSSSPPSIAGSRTLQLVRRAGGGGGVLPASYQLSAGNFSPRKVDPILIYPRPDVETASWAKHRRHYPGIGYRVPIGVAFGSGPLVYELIAGPAGASIGEFLVVSGDTLIVNEDYGVLTWASPVNGFFDFHVRVSFQDGFAPIDVLWTLEVTPIGTLVIDPVSGSDTTGDGTIGSPFQTINAWWKNDLTDITYSEFQVCYRGGTHNVSANNSATGVSAGSWRLNGTDKPLVHYPYTGETVEFDMSNTTIVMGIGTVYTGQTGSDCYFGKIKYSGGLNATDNPKHFAINDAHSPEVYAAGGAGQRMTWDTPHHIGLIPEAATTNNCGPMFSPNAGTGRKRHYFYAHRPTFENCYPGPTSDNGLEFNGYYLSTTVNVLVDHVTCINTDFGYSPIITKGGGTFWCVRFLDSVQAPLQQFTTWPLGSYDLSIAGPFELSYAKILYRKTGTTTAAFTSNVNFGIIDGQNPDHKPEYLVRSTLSREPVTGRAALRTRSWPLEIDGILGVADNFEYGGGNTLATGFINYTVANNPLDADLNLTGQARTDKLGLFGAEIKAE